MPLLPFWALVARYGVNLALETCVTGVEFCLTVLCAAAQSTDLFQTLAVTELFGNWHLQLFLFLSQYRTTRPCAEPDYFSQHPHVLFV
jgi:hypothetical protein